MPDTSPTVPILRRFDSAPTRAAVFAGGRTYSGAEMAAQARTLARRLRAAGVAHEQVVAVHLERSVDHLVALLGTLACGGVYLPLEVGAPAGLRARVTAKARPHLAVTRPAWAARFTCPALALPDTGGAQPSAEPLPEADPASAAYLVFTSGTSGDPRGVVVSRAALARKCAALASRYGLRESDRVLQFAASAFDVALEEVLPTWWAGAAVALPEADALDSLPGLLQWIDAAGVTVVNLPASLWQDWARAAEEQSLPWPRALRLVIAGSEPVSSSAYARWKRAAAPGVRWLNAYGTSETTITATVFEPAPGTRPGGATVPIGRPLDDTSATVLDAALEPVPEGATGELCLGGSGVARGYLDDPALTAARFVPDPAGASPGARLYRTGDLVRRLRDGNLEFVSRLDDQLKIRGMRLEPGQIEALLRSAGMREAVVVPQPFAGGERRLVAYVVAEAGRPASPERLRQACLAELAEALVPWAFVALERLPRLANGKLDRAALPPVEREHLATGPWAAPRGERQRALAAIWCELLGLEQVGVDDDFLALGGHSLLAMRLVSRVRDRLQAELKAADVLELRTIAKLAERLERAPSGEGAPWPPPLRPAERSGELPLSFPQEAVWFLNTLAPGNLAYNTQVVVRWYGRFDHGALERAYTALVRRHEILRTSFQAREGRPPVQVVHAARPMTIPLTDLTCVAESERARRAQELVERETAGAFRLDQWPLARWSVLRLAPEEHWLVLVEHHFIHDGWSLARLLHELQLEYDACVRGWPSPLGPPRIQFGDYALWQRAWLAGEVLERYVRHWAQALADLQPLPPLAASRRAGTRRSHLGASLWQELPPQLSRALRALAERQGVTLFVVMLAAFKLLLMRQTGCDDVALGSTSANRVRPETEDVLGMLVNTLVLRTSLKGDISFGELLQRVQRTVWSAMTWQDVPFEKLVEALRPPRQAGRNPFFDVMFSFHDSAMPSLELPGCRGLVDYRHNGSAKFDLNLVVIPQAGRCVDAAGAELAQDALRIEWEYAQDALAAPLVRQLQRRYQHLLELVVADPNCRLGALELLEPAEREALEARSRGPAVPEAALVPERIDAWARRFPEAPAVSGAGQSFTYGDVQRLSDDLARDLRRLGVGPEVRVGLCLERSPRLIVGILAVLKAGGAYLPLDPAYPTWHLEQVLRDAAPLAVVTEQPGAHRLPPGPWRTVFIDGPAVGAGGERTPAGWPRPEPAALAYVLHTSGSTGKPKGVMVAHAALANVVAGLEARLGLSSGDTLVAVTTLAFDIAVAELLLPLCVGARVVVAESATAAEGARLARLLQEADATFLQATPATWRLLLDAGWTGSQRLTALCGGEALPADLAAALAARTGRLFNLYGPTETTVWVTAWEVDAQRPIELGDPLDNVRLYLLDARGEPVAAGLPGEVHVGGRCVARGYLNAPVVTAQRFIPDPFGDTPGGRLYRTGDLARRGLDGALEFLGRVDDQLKIRGFRIEPGAVEALLRDHPTVAAAAVGARRGPDGLPQLAAAVVPRTGQVPTPDELRAFVAARLPAYHAPSTFAFVERLPLTSNGKLDRRAVAALPVAEAHGPAPLPGSLEAQVAALWGEVLGRASLGLHDDFFALGGHSLLVPQIAWRIEQTLGLSIGIEVLFEAPTVAQFAQALMRAGLAAAQGESVEAILSELEAEAAPEERPE